MPVRCPAKEPNTTQPKSNSLAIAGRPTAIAFLPQDVAVREWGTNKTRVEQLWLDFELFVRRGSRATRSTTASMRRV